MSTVTYIATRDTDRASANEEDRAMAHRQYYAGNELYSAQVSLYIAMQNEADWLTDPRYRSARALRRAADLIEAADKTTTLVPETGKAWSAAHLDAAGLVWRITRTER